MPIMDDEEGGLSEQAVAERERKIKPWNERYWDRYLEETGRQGLTPSLSKDEFMAKLGTENLDPNYRQIFLEEINKQKIEKEKISEQDLLKKQREQEAAAIESKRQGALTNVEELARRISEARGRLYGETETAGRGLISSITAQRKQRLAELGDLLAKQREEAFAANAPDILEQLSGRGLLHSSAVGTELGREKSRLQTISENALRAQALQDLDIQQQMEAQLADKLMGIKESGLGFETQLGTYGVGEKSRLSDLDLASLQELGRGGISALSELSRAGLEREYSLADRLYQSDIAKQIADAEAKSREQAAWLGLAGNVLGIGAGVALGRVGRKAAGIAGAGKTSSLPVNTDFGVA